MTIETISYINGLSNRDRLRLTTKLINSSESDFMIFSGHTIGFVNDIEKLKGDIQNKHSEVILELQDLNSSIIMNCLYRISRGKLKSLNTNQLFTRSFEIEGNFELARRLLHEFEFNRSFKIDGLSFLIIQCGELNILKNIQNEGNKVEFRLSDDVELNRLFNKILSRANVILNPIHSPMGNQGKMKKRREFLSQNNRYYFSTSNTNEGSSNLGLKSLQYAYYNGQPLLVTDVKVLKNSIIRKFEIK